MLTLCQLGGFGILGSHTAFNSFLIFSFKDDDDVLHRKLHNIHWIPDRWCCNWISPVLTTQLKPALLLMFPSSCVLAMNHLEFLPHWGCQLFPWQIFLSRNIVSFKWPASYADPIGHQWLCLEHLTLPQNFFIWFVLLVYVLSVWVSTECPNYSVIW